jgi:alpha-tubulin suppressor-like RCC1 family protein
VALGLNHTLILSLDTCKVFALGDNTTGNLGQGHFFQVEKPTLISSLG